TPLGWASEMGSTESAKKLLEAGADPNVFEHDGWSALHWAARNGHLDVLKLLLSYGARTEVRDSRGHTPL
ncbi:ankyrin, partial [Lophiostoma macrostomum CBS 122681]